MDSTRPQDRSHRSRQPIALALVALAVLLLALRLALGTDAVESRATREADVADAQAESSIERAAPDDEARRLASRSGSTPPESSSSPATDAPGTAPDEAAALRRRLTSEIEATLTGALDPSAILRAGLTLLELRVAKDDLPSTAPDGSLRYPLEPCPPGVRAELWVARSPHASAENVLALRVEVDAPADPYLVEGAARKDPVAHIQAFLDEDGRMTDLVLMTDVAPSGTSASFGLDVREGRIPQGILFHTDLERPSEWKAEAYGLDGGSDRSWNDPIALLGDPWPEPAALDELREGLLGLLSEARR